MDGTISNISHSKLLNDVDSNISTNVQDDSLTDESEYVTNQIAFLNSFRIVLIITFMSVYFVVTTIFILGSLVILFQKAFVRNAYAIGQKSLASLELGFSVTVIIGYLFKDNINSDMSTWTPSVCRLYKTAYFIFATSTNWCVVYLTLVRYLSVRVPVKVNTGNFVRKAHVSLILTNCLICIFYATAYHEFTRLIVDSTDRPFTDECFSYANFPVNQYLYRTFLTIPQFFIPAACILIFNILLYTEYKSIGAKRKQLRDVVFKHSENIANIKRSLCESESWDQKKRFGIEDETQCADSLEQQQQMQIVNARSSVGVDFHKTSTMCTLPVTKDVSQSLDSCIDILETATINQNKQRLLQKLQIEKRYMRRVTIAYDMLLTKDVSTMSILKFSDSGTTPQQPVKSERVPLSKQTSLRFKVSQIRDGESQKSFNKMLMLNSVLFVCLRGPLWVWYISSSLILNTTPLDVARYRLIHIWLTIISCIGHASGIMMYILYSRSITIATRRMVRNYKSYYQKE